MRDDEAGNKIIHQYPKGSTLEAYIFDQGVFRRNGQFEFTNTTDQYLVPSEEYISHTLTLIEYLTPLLSEVAGIDVQTHVQSEGDDVCLGFPDNSFTVGSMEDAPNDVTRASGVDEGRILFSRMFQQVFDGSSATYPDLFVGVCYDTFQSFIFSPENPRAMCSENDITALATPILTVNYTYNPLDGFYKNMNLTGKDGQTITEAWYVRGENE
jgi:hypothetical protein